MPLVIKVGVGFQAAKEWQHLGKRPAGIAQRRPFIVVAWRATQRERRIGGRTVPTSLARAR